MTTRFMKSLLVATSLGLLGSTASALAETPGSAPAAGPGKHSATVRTDADPVSAAGLKVFYEKYGKYRMSADAAGSNTGSNVVTIQKPTADAVVDKAYVMAATYPDFYSYAPVPIANGDISLDGKPITWNQALVNTVPEWYGAGFYNVRADVTSLVSAKLNAAAKGNVNFTFAEASAKDGYIDGEIMVVVFKVPSATTSRTVSLLFGGQQLSGDRFELTLAKAIDPAVRGSVARMGLGISYSYQGTSQYSIVDVNGRRLSTSAGGQDDGSDTNGALITVGGVGDSFVNPASPTATPTDTRSDDEAYSLLPYITKTSTIIRVDTSNPSNDDNILFAWFDLSTDADVNKDTDGDGLLDSWERYGYDYDGDGKIDVNLPRLGANYLKKDIYVGYAWMDASASEAKSHQPSSTVLNYVKTAFANAPVANPNGTTGINLHFVSKGSVAHDDNLSPAWDEFDTLMNPKFTAAERRIYHRLLCAHMYDGGTSSGLSRNIPASDFIETLGGWPTNPGTTMQRAGTIMHELGHNLGLRHGGVDHENYKPNHLSIMSYLNQMLWLKKDGAPKLDYERFDLYNLNETALNEKSGLNRVGGDTPIATYGVRWLVNGVTKTKSTSSNAYVNWNGTGNSSETGVQADINGSGNLSTLAAHYIEWKHIVYDGGDIGAGAPASAKASDTIAPENLHELTAEEMARISASLQESK